MIAAIIIESFWDFLVIWFELSLAIMFANWFVGKMEKWRANWIKKRIDEEINKEEEKL